MTTNKSRLSKLERHKEAGAKKKYLCVIGLKSSDTPEEKAKGYKVQPCTVQFGGTGGEPFYLATRKELDEFAARPDVEILTINITTAGEDEDTPSG